MNRKIVSAIMLTLLLASMLTLASKIQPVKAEPKTWTVDDDEPAGFYTIQEAINAASLGDMVFVKEGTYYENVIVNKTVALVGEERETTIIDANGTGTAIEVRANSVNISGFTIKSSENYGIYLNNAIYCNITKNSITNNWEPIRLYWSLANIISRNDITNNSNGIGLYWSLNNIISDNNITDNGNDGIHIFRFSKYNRISGNNITNNNEGIHLIDSSNNCIYGNNITNNGFEGIGLASSSNNTISGNNIADNGYGRLLLIREGYGIWLSSSSNNTIYHNNFINNTNQVWSSYSTNTWDYGYPSGGNYWNDYTGIDSNNDGIGDTLYVIDANNQDRYPLMHPWSSLPVHNINTGLGYATIQEAINAPETLDGHTIFVEAGTYYENVVVNKQVRLLGENRIGTIIDANATDIVLNIVANNVSLSGFTIKGSGSTCPDSGVLLQGVANCRIFGNRIIENLGDGIFLISCSNNVILGNEVVGNDVDGISVSGSASNTISDNNVTGNGWSGIGLFGYSSDNNVTSNNVVNNPEGIAVVISARNEISENTIVSNSNWGISIYQSLNNSIFHNEFNNSLQINSDGSPNMWDNGYPSGGNYWGDYAGVDLNHDGIGDIPYAIDANNHDNHPLMGMFSDFNATSEYQVQTICNSTISAFQFNGTAIIFKVVGEGGTTGFCRICIPTALMNSPYDVLVDGIEVPFTLLSCSNATQSYLYFAYAHSTHEIIIRTHIVPPPPLLVSISPVSALTYFGQSVTFTSTASGGTPPYGYQWYMNDSAVSGANSNSWTFALQPIGNYSVYLNVTDSFGSTAKSNEASVTVVPQLTASISPMSASVLVGQPVAFTSTVSGGYAPYSHQWYLNGAPVSAATSTSWTFTPTTNGIYYIYLKVTDPKGNAAQSDIARITVATVPVGGYSFPIQVHTKTEPVLPYIALIVALTAILTKLRPKTKRKH